jgi:hypothetical protein
MTDFIYLQWVIKVYLCINVISSPGFYASDKTGEILLTKIKALICKPA